MPLPAGRTIKLSPMRRLMCTFLSFSRKVPLVAIERRMRLGDLVAARQSLSERPSWFALFIKAFALVADEMPVLRRAYLTFPTHRIHEHACNVASITIVREVDNEDAVFMSQMRYPEKMTLVEIDERIRHIRHAPVKDVADFRRQHLSGRMPGWLRTFFWWLALRCVGDWRARYFGTFGITGVAALGSTSLNLLSPLTCTFVYSVMEPDGSMMIRLFYDHRIMDGVEPAAALRRMEEVLLTTLQDEMLAQFPAADDVAPQLLRMSMGARAA